MNTSDVILSELKRPAVALPDFDEYVKRERERRKIKCPRCFHLNDPEFAAEDGELITLFGTDPCEEAIQVKCARCESVLAVREDVKRTYEVELIEAGDSEGDGDD